MYRKQEAERTYTQERNSTASTDKSENMTREKEVMLQSRVKRVNERVM